MFHKFTNGSLPNHANYFYDRQNNLLDGNRTDPIHVYQYCNIPNCTCQVQQPAPPPPPQTNPLQTQEVLKVGMGDKPKIKEVPKVGTGDKPKTKEGPKVGTGDKPQISEVLNVGIGDKPKKNEVPKVGAVEAPMVPMEQLPQRNVKFKQDRKRCSTDTDGKNPHKKKEYTEMPVFLI